MTRHGINEVIPGLLYQRAHFLTWTHEEKARLLEEAGIDVVVNLWRRLDPDLSPDGVARIYLNWPMDGDEPPPDWELLVAFCLQLMRSKRRVLVHCEAGVNRSAWLVAQLVRGYTGATPEVALRVTEGAIPRARINRKLREHILNRGQP